MFGADDRIFIEGRIRLYAVSMAVAIAAVSAWEFVHGRSVIDPAGAGTLRRRVNRSRPMTIRSSRQRRPVLLAPVEGRLWRTTQSVGHRLQPRSISAANEFCDAMEDYG